MLIESAESPLSLGHPWESSERPCRDHLPWEPTRDRSTLRCHQAAANVLPFPTSCLFKDFFDLQVAVGTPLTSLIVSQAL